MTDQICTASACQSADCGRRFEQQAWALKDLEARFEKFKKEVFVRRGTLAACTQSYQSAVRDSLKHQAAACALSHELGIWHQLAGDHPDMPLKDALSEVTGITDPLDVERVQDLPPVEFTDWPGARS